MGLCIHCRGDEKIQEADVLVRSVIDAREVTIADNPKEYWEAVFALGGLLTAAGNIRLLRS